MKYQILIHENVSYSVCNPLYAWSPNESVNYFRGDVSSILGFLINFSIKFRATIMNLAYAPDLLRNPYRNFKSHFDIQNSNEMKVQLQWDAKYEGIRLTPSFDFINCTGTENTGDMQIIADVDFLSGTTLILWNVLFLYENVWVEFDRIGWKQWLKLIILIYGYVCKVLWLSTDLHKTKI